jgi:hypothetical protein
MRRGDQDEEAGERRMIELLESISFTLDTFLAEYEQNNLKPAETVTLTWGAPQPKGP